MMKDNPQVMMEQQERVRLGQIAREGLGGEFWVEIVKPILDSMLRGITDISDIDVSSEKKAATELIGRKLAAKYFPEIETLINGYIIDADTVLNIVEKQKKTLPLFRSED